MLVISIFPSIIDKLSLFFGISYPPSLLFLFAILFLIFINFRHSKLITYQREQIIELAQIVALLKENQNSKK